MVSSAGSIEQVLKEFMAEKVSLDERDRRNSVAYVKELVEKRLIPKMRSLDPLFDALYEKLYYTGSYYENLKVAVTDEFDLNVILRLPFRSYGFPTEHPTTEVVPRKPTPSARKRTTRKANKKLGRYRIEVDPQFPGFAQFRLGQRVDLSLQNHPDLQVKYRSLPTLFDSGGTMLSAKKINEWMQSVVDRALFDRSGFVGVVRSITRSRNGPASTLNIIANDGNQIDMDLVPVIRLPTPVLNGMVSCRYFQQIPHQCREGFLVPKLPLSGKDSYFRVSIPDAERYLMQDKNCAKTLIRIFKAIRDIEKWSVASYQIKTMFLWKFIEKPYSMNWQESQLTNLFVEMLEVFRDTMARRQLPHIFFPNFNLLSDMSPNETVPIAHRLDNYVKLVKGNKPAELAKILTQRTPNSWSKYP